MSDREFQTLLYRVEGEAPHQVARVTLDRPASRNAQNKRMTYEINACFTRAAHDPDVRVIVFDAEGPHFCSGHDNRDTESMRDLADDGLGLVFPVEGLGDKGVEGHMAFEEEFYLNMCWRWRNIPKPVIAACQGKTIAGGLPLLWVCDVIVAADNALFSDPTVSMGVNGVEYHAHGWELGPRKAKELLFTGDWWSADEALRLGMVNHVVPLDELHSFTMDMAYRIAQRPAMALKLAKESVNQMLEAQGQWTAFRAAFSLQHVAHAHNRVKYGIPVDPGPRAAAKD